MPDVYKRQSLGRLETLDDLKYMPFLRRLHIAFQEEVDITGVAAAKRLEELSLIHVGVQDLEPVAGLTTLQKLCVGWNEISDISPVANLSALTSLGIWNNRVTDISAVPVSYTHLDVYKRQVQDLAKLSPIVCTANERLIGLQRNTGLYGWSRPGALQGKGLG